MKQTFEMNPIYIIRSTLGFSQEYVASQLNITQQNYSRLEKKPENITLKRLLQLADIFHVDTCELIPSNKRKETSEQSAIHRLFPELFLQKESYEKQINELKEEIEFLKNIVRSYTDSPK